MDKAALEASLSEQLGIKVIIDEYAPKGTVFLFNLENNPYWDDEVKEWVALPADEDFIQSVFQVAKNVIRLKMYEMKQEPHLTGPDQLGSLKFTD